MKQVIKLSLLFLLFSSCQNQQVLEMGDQIEVLQKEIAGLEQQNKILSDSLDNRLYKKLKNSNVACFPLEENVFVDKSNPIKVLFYENWTLPLYDVYQIVGSGKETKKKLVLKDQTGYHFEIDFHPKTIQEDSLVFETVFKIEGKPLTIQSYSNFDLKLKK
jgi:hypothetical protein